MVDLLEFVMENDPSPPDLIGQLIEYGILKSSSKQWPGSLDQKETNKLRLLKIKHYKQNFLKVLKHILPQEGF